MPTYPIDYVDSSASVGSTAGPRQAFIVVGPADGAQPCLAFHPAGKDGTAFLEVVHRTGDVFQPLPGTPRIALSDAEEWQYRSQVEISGFQITAVPSEPRELA